MNEDMHEVELRKAVPERIVDSLLRYIKTGCPTGGFLRAVLSNDLFEAVARADEECVVALPVLVKWIYNEAPSACWGTEKKVDAWLAEHRRN